MDAGGRGILPDALALPPASTILNPKSVILLRVLVPSWFKNLLFSVPSVLILINGDVVIETLQMNQIKGRLDKSPSRPVACKILLVAQSL